MFGTINQIEWHNKWHQSDGTGGTVPNVPFFLRPLCPICCGATLSFDFAFGKVGRRGRFRVAHFATVPGVPLFVLLYLTFRSSDPSVRERNNHSSPAATSGFVASGKEPGDCVYC